jgi:hypothetical protein
VINKLVSGEPGALHSQFQPGDIVCHTANPQELYTIIMVLDRNVWTIRESDGDEVMHQVENLKAA